MTRSVRLTMVCIAVFCLATFAIAGEMAGKLDGKSFEVTMTSGDESSPDTLIFADGTFDSVECRQYGFGAVPYNVEMKGDAWTFTAVATSEAEGMASWEGTVGADSISGKMTWTKPGQDPIVYEFSGEPAP